MPQSRRRPTVKYAESLEQTLKEINLLIKTVDLENRVSVVGTIQVIGDIVNRAIAKYARGDLNARI